MPKQKTHKGMSKRIIVKKKGGKKATFSQRVATQNHFNSREKSKDSRAKRKTHGVHFTNLDKIRRSLKVK